MALPSRLGSYEIVGRIATGGMAELLLAKGRGAPGMERRVAIKRMLPQLAGEREFVERFLDEARIATALEHPNIVRIHETGSEAGEHYLVMEHLDGADVRRVMEAARARSVAVPLDCALGIVTGVCAALQYAHERRDPEGALLGLVHRDVSPPNIIVTFEGGVKLLDFGIAKGAHRMARTRTGTLHGKVPYMSPEQCRSEVLDARSDLFSLCVVLWELTTGRLLFRGTELEILKAITESDVPAPSTVVPGYPPDLEQIVMKGLRRDRSERHGSADELSRELQSFVRTGGIALSPQPLVTFMDRLFPDGDAGVSVESTANEEPRTAPLHRDPGPRPVATPPGRTRRALVMGLAGAAVVAAVGALATAIARRPEGPAREPSAASAAAPTPDVTSPPGPRAAQASAASPAPASSPPSPPAKTITRPPAPPRRGPRPPSTGRPRPTGSDVDNRPFPH